MEDFKAKIYYYNNIINDYILPENFDDFKNETKQLFSIDCRLNKEISLYYTFLEHGKGDQIIEKFILVNADEGYKEMRQRIKNDIKDKMIILEIDGNIINRKIPQTFEEEVNLVVERELKDAFKRIRQYLTANNVRNYPRSKIQDKKCDNCNKNIIGDIYKKAINIEEKYYCIDCSNDINEPLIIIQ